MKKPRVSDFDPHAKSHTLKSSMADFPAIEKPSTAPKQATANAAEQGTPVPGDQSTRVPPASTSDAKREIKKRHPFDIYKDQLAVLKRYSIEEQQQGGIGSMSAMARQALDDYIAKRNGGQ